MLVSREGLRKAIKPMDYIIAGLAALSLFVYLLYALLKSERF
jgi:K+-transporting ATPase KdpF subunit